MWGLGTGTTSSDKETCRRCNQFRMMCMCKTSIELEDIGIFKKTKNLSGVKNNENTLDSMAIYASVWRRKVEKERNLTSLHSVVQQAVKQAQEDKNKQNAVKNYATTWKRKAEKQKSIRSNKSVENEKDIDKSIQSDKLDNEKDKSLVPEEVFKPISIATMLSMNYNIKTNT